MKEKRIDHLMRSSVEEMNQVIAIFDGWAINDDGTVSNDSWRDKFQLESERWKVGILQYHSSWDWLMPVVEKISKMPLLKVDGTPCTDPVDTCYPITFNMPTDDGKQVMFRFKGFSVHTADKLIDAVHAAVYEVAEWHNSNTSTSK